MANASPDNLGTVVGRLTQELAALARQQGDTLRQLLDDAGRRAGQDLDQVKQLPDDARRRLKELVDPPDWWSILLFALRRGREKPPARGAASSGLRFDAASPDPSRSGVRPRSRAPSSSSLWRSGAVAAPIRGRPDQRHLFNPGGSHRRPDSPAGADDLTGLLFGRRAPSATASARRTASARPTTARRRSSAAAAASSTRTGRPRRDLNRGQGRGSPSTRANS
ncbi:hypothetical protein [Streptomyces sp. TLI_171]|uniref:hypothetical protein n=1 Tax=Streptomyces sp. TLI_171 TaxID=1938859 RepID=UPI000C18B461|nr:hypothetical protein [Streptomyces sp. TLI_171]RKE17903.1 hypothetical protein BX266_1174 [Streptomyces sp. TLI_171]